MTNCVETKATIKIDKMLWKSFQHLARVNGSNASQEIRAFITSYVSNQGDIEIPNSVQTQVQPSLQTDLSELQERLTSVENLLVSFVNTQKDG